MFVCIKHKNIENVIFMKNVLHSESFKHFNHAISFSSKDYNSFFKVFKRYNKFTKKLYMVFNTNENALISERINEYFLPLK